MNVPEDEYENPFLEWNEASIDTDEVAGADPYNDPEADVPTEGDYEQDDGRESESAADPSQVSADEIDIAGEAEHRLNSFDNGQADDNGQAELAAQEGRDAPVTGKPKSVRSDAEVIAAMAAHVRRDIALSRGEVVSDEDLSIPSPTWEEISNLSQRPPAMPWRPGGPQQRPPARTGRFGNQPRGVTIEPDSGSNACESQSEYAIGTVSDDGPLEADTAEKYEDPAVIDAPSSLRHGSKAINLTPLRCATEKDNVAEPQDRDSAGSVPRAESEVQLSTQVPNLYPDPTLKDSWNKTQRPPAPAPWPGVPQQCSPAETAQPTANSVEPLKGIVPATTPMPMSASEEASQRAEGLQSVESAAIRADVHDVHESQLRFSAASAAAPSLQGSALAVSADWPEPVPFADDAPPAVPKDLFPGVIGAYIAALSEFTETPPELTTVAVLGAVSCAAAGKLLIEAEPGYVEPGHLWLCAIAESGIRRTAVTQAAMAPITEWEKMERERLGPEIRHLGYQRKAIEAAIEKIHKHLAEDAIYQHPAEPFYNAIAKLEQQLPRVPVPPRLWTDNPNPGNVKAMLVQHRGRLSIIFDESHVFDVLVGRRSEKANFDALVKGYAGIPVRFAESSREESIVEDPAITIAMHAQPGVLAEVRANSSVRGLLSRCLFAVSQSTLGMRANLSRPMAARVTEGYGALLSKLLAWDPAQRFKLSLAGHALSVWKRFQNLVEFELREGQRLSGIADWGSKLPGAALRLAGLLHVADEPDMVGLDPQIGEDTMMTAVNFCELLMSHARAAFGVMADGVQTDEQKIFSWLISQRKPQVPKRNCFHAHQYKFKRVSDFDSILSALERRNLIRTIEKKTETNPERLIQLNPRFLNAES